MLMHQLMSMMIYLDLILMVLLSVAFVTLLERKILGYIQDRKGPNKVGLSGLLQPFSDAIKLFTKENFYILKSNYIYYLFCPILMLILMLMLWGNFKDFNGLNSSRMNVVLILCMMSLGVLFIMLAGWSSNSSYSLIGGLRSVAQSISYEVSMIFIILGILVITESFDLEDLIIYQEYSWFYCLNSIGCYMLFISFLAEMNRTPFDLSEGESELVSGFNTEYMSGSFAIIFIAEYGMILFIMYLFTLMFFGGGKDFYLFFFIYLFMVYMVIWVRGTFPRFRYDNLMFMTWKVYLPVALNLLIGLVFLKMMFYYYWNY